MRFSRPVMSNSLWPHGLQHALTLWPSPSPKICLSSCPLHWWHPLLLLPSIFPSIRGFSNESAIHIKWPKCWSFSFSISSFSEYSGLISLKIECFHLSAVQRDSQESFPEPPYFEGMNSSVICLLYSPALTTICDHWEDHSLDYMDLHWQSNVSAFQHTV